MRSLKWLLITWDPMNKTYPHHGSGKRIVTGSFFSILGQVINSLNKIILVPFFLLAWGKLFYGEWLVIYAFVSYLAISDIGLQHYVINRLTQIYSRGNIRKYNQVLGSTLKLYALITIVILCTFLAFVLFTPYDKWLNITQSSLFDIRLTTIILGVSVLTKITVDFIGGLYNSFGQFPKRILLINIDELLLIALLVCVLILRGGFIWASLIYLIASLGLGIYYYFDIKRNHPDIKFDLIRSKLKISLAFVIPSLLFLLITLASIFRLQGMLLMISSVIGVSAVAIYSIHRTLANIIQQAMLAISNSVWPEVTSSYERKNYKKIDSLHSFLMKITLFISFSVSIILFFIGKDILALWTDMQIDFQPILWSAILIYVVLTIIWETSGTFLLASNQHKKYALTRFFGSVAAILVSFILVKKIGLIGIPIGLLLSESLSCLIIIPNQTLKTIHGDGKMFLINVVGKGLIFLVLFFSTSFLINFYFENLYIKVVALIINTILGLTLSYLYWLNQNERSKIKSVFQLLHK